MKQLKNALIKFILEDTDFEGDQRDRLDFIFKNNIRCAINLIDKENNIFLQAKEASIESINGDIVYCTLYIDEENYKNIDKANCNFSRTWIEGESSSPIICFAE